MQNVIQLSLENADMGGFDMHPSGHCHHIHGHMVNKGRWRYCEHCWYRLQGETRGGRVGGEWEGWVIQVNEVFCLF